MVRICACGWLHSSTALRTMAGLNEACERMTLIRTWKHAGDCMETRMRRRGQFLASRGSLRIPVSGEFADPDSSSFWTARGLFLSAANACSWIVEPMLRLRMRTVRDRDCGRGLSADMDCSRTRIGRVSDLFLDCSWWRIC